MNLLKRYRTDGTVEPKRHGGGQVAKLNREQEAVVGTLVEENNDAIKARVMRATGAMYRCAVKSSHNGTIGSKA